ncbi:MAG: HipA domain-containing protein [Enterocloster clostridioformis]
MNDFLKMLIFDYLIGNSDRHQNNWAILLEENQMTWSPLYDNSSSLCAYISERSGRKLFGRDKNRWKALVDTKSKSLLRCNVCDEKRPTHLNVLKYIKKTILQRRVNLRKNQCCNVGRTNSRYIKQYSTAELSDNKKRLIFEFLLAKNRCWKEVYMGEDE